MTTKLFAVQHLVNGQDITTMTDEALYSAISKAQQNIERLEEIMPKPNRLVKQISAKRQELLQLIDFIDSLDKEAENVGASSTDR